MSKLVKLRVCLSSVFSQPTFLHYRIGGGVCSISAKFWLKFPAESISRSNHPADDKRDGKLIPAKGKSGRKMADIKAIDASLDNETRYPAAACAGNPLIGTSAVWQITVSGMEFPFSFFIPPLPIEMKSTRAALCAVTRKICVHHSFALRHCYIILDFSAPLLWFFFFILRPLSERWVDRIEGVKRAAKAFHAFLSDWMRQQSESEWALGASRAGGISGYATVWSCTSSRLHSV